jgi:hypothetical protein
MIDKLLTVKEASEWATKHIGKNVTTSNIAYLILNQKSVLMRDLKE